MKYQICSIDIPALLAVHNIDGSLEVGKHRAKIVIFPLLFDRIYKQRLNNVRNSTRFAVVFTHSSFNHRIEVHCLKSVKDS